METGEAWCSPGPFGDSSLGNTLCANGRFSGALGSNLQSGGRGMQGGFTALGNLPFFSQALIVRGDTPSAALSLVVEIRTGGVSSMRLISPLSL